MTTSRRVQSPNSIVAASASPFDLGWAWSGRGPMSPSQRNQYHSQQRRQFRRSPAQPESKDRGPQMTSRPQFLTPRVGYKGGQVSSAT
jgi:hypothetical protein